MAEPEGIPVILFVGRLLWNKGIGELVAASRLLRQRNVVCRIVLTGVPDVENPVSVPQRLVENWQNEGIIEWRGYQAKIRDVYAQSHIVCLPSYREGIPKVLLEAAACGRPIVTTDSPGCREVVKHGVNGFLVPVRSVHPLADALQMLVEQPDLRLRLGLNGRKLIEERFHVKDVVQKTLAIYDKLCKYL